MHKEEDIRSVSMQASVDLGLPQTLVTLLPVKGNLGMTGFTMVDAYLAVGSSHLNFGLFFPLSVSLVSLRVASTPQ